MAFLRVVVRLAIRNRGRALITAVGVGVTMLAFLLLRTIVSSWYTVNADSSESDQLEVRHKISIAFGLYERMADKIRGIPGVEAVSPLIWFSGYYKDERARFGQLAVEGREFFRIFPEYDVKAEEMTSFLGDVSGALVGGELATRYGWKVGDKVTLTGTIYPGDWDLTVRGIYQGDPHSIDLSWLFMHYKRLAPEEGHTQRLMVKAPASVAKQIDRLFANTDTPTKTQSWLSVRRSWASWSSGVIEALDLAGVLILFVLILVLGNTMAMASREVTREHATMRAIGYRSRHIMLLVMAQGFLMAAAGVALALAVAPATLHGLSKVMEDRLGGSWQLELDLRVTVLAVVVALAAGMFASAWPAWRSGRLRIVEALRWVT